MADELVAGYIRVVVWLHPVGVLYPLLRLKPRRAERDAIADMDFNAVPEGAHKERPHDNTCDNEDDGQPKEGCGTPACQPSRPYIRRVRHDRAQRSSLA